MALTNKDIADLRLHLVRNFNLGSFTVDRRVFGELLALADGFLKVRKLAAIDLNKNVPAELRYFRARVQDAVREFSELQSAAERQEQQG
jgi:hypothetical protein